MSEIIPIIYAVQQAAHLCRRVQQTFITVSEKQDREPVTIADYGSQALIGRAIRHAFPVDAVLAEENGDQFSALVAPEQRRKITALLADILNETITETDVVNWLNHGHHREAARTWIIDPIDGTLGFLASRRYTIAVGLRSGDKITGGIMACPGYGEGGRLFFTEDGKQAFVQPLWGGSPRPVSVSPRRRAEALRVAESWESAHADHSALATIYAAAGFADLSIERVDGQDKYALVAAGDADFYVRLSPKKDYQHKSWDHAAGYAIVTAAGGKVTDFNGVALDFSQGELLPHTGMVVSNGFIHDDILRGVQVTLNP